MTWKSLRDLRALPVMLAASVLSLAAVSPASAQVGAATSGAPSPSPLSVRTRDQTGRIVVRATRITQPIRIDGRLDEAAYREVPAITDFVQQEPNEGAPITERTEAWVMFDDRNIYIACRCRDEHPERIVANDMRRDSTNLRLHDNFAVAFDTFADRRNGVMFNITPVGALFDASVTNERPSSDWNTVWDGAAARSEEGWAAEMAIPFKSLRYKPGREQTWGIQLRRAIRSKNEQSFLSPVSPAWALAAIVHSSASATLVGLEAPPPSTNLEIKPYAITRLTTDLMGRTPVRNDVEPDIGLDVKYGVTEGLTADFTWNTDFAQVEADEAQVNLTRFSLFFPEKRDFFLEGQGIFQFGQGNSVGGDAGGDAPTIFYSRRIGLSGSRVVPIVAGGRLTGKAGPWSIGAMNIGTSDEPAAGAAETNFTVVRIRRDVLRRSNIGGILTRRSVSTVAPGASDVWGVDGSFTFYENVYLSAYLAKSRTEGRRGDDLSYRAQFNYNSDRYGLALDRLVAEQHFNPEVGFLRRENFRRSFLLARFSPRTTNNRLVRKFTYEGNLEYITDNNSRLESRELRGEFRTDFHSSDAIAVQYLQLYEFLPAPFLVSEGVRIPVGRYSFDNLRASYTAGSQHRVSGSASFDIGSFYDGDKKTAAFRGRVELTPQLGVEPNLSFNWIDLPQGRFTTTVAGARATFTMTPRMFAGMLMQYSTGDTSFSTNLRFRWEYQPGSDLVVVYTEGRDTLPARGTALENRGFVVKINRLFRF